MAAPEPPDTTEMIQPSVTPLQLSFALPKAPHTTVHLHLTIYKTALMLFLTTNAAEAASGGAAPMGSFVYALPDRTHPGDTLSTALYVREGTLDFATRAARVLARRTGRGAYVGSSMSFAGTLGFVEEEAEGFRKVVEVVVGEVEKRARA